MRVFLLITVLLGMKCVVGQTYLNDTLSDGSRQSYFQNVIEVDSGYICFGGKTVLYPNKLLPKLTLSFIDYDGNFSHTYISPDTVIKEFSWYGNNQFVVNNAGNFVHVFDCMGPTGRFPKLVELSPQGQVVQEANLQPHLDINHTSRVGHTVYYNSSLNEYDLLLMVHDTVLLNAQNKGYGRTVYLKLDDGFNLNESLIIYDNQYDYPFWGSGLLYEEDERVVVMTAFDVGGLTPTHNGKVVLGRIDASGNWVDQVSYTDGQLAIWPKGLKMAADSNYLFTYERNYLSEPNLWLGQNHLIKLDKQFNLIWKTAIDPWIEYNSSFYFQQNQVIVNPDSSIIVVGGGILLDAPDPQAIAQTGAQISKYNNDGEQEWLRRIFKIPNIQIPSLDEEAGFVIKDVIRNSKGGYTMVGYVDYYYDGVSQLKTYAYIAETNCLGFMGDPVALASVSYEDSLRVNFHNNSFQAGSFSWYFGDGDSLVSGENLIDFSHTYTSADSFEVLLVAHGCEVQDSLRFWVYPNQLEIEDSTLQVEFGGHFYLYPNPASGNQGLNILLHPVGDCNSLKLVFYDEKGRLLRELPVQNMEQSLHIDQNFSPGTYQIVLRDEQKGLIERQTLLITN